MSVPANLLKKLRDRLTDRAVVRKVAHLLWGKSHIRNAFPGGILRETH
jgi:hypothetical protein